MPTVEELEKPRVSAGDFSTMRELIGLVSFGDYFVNFADDALYKWDGERWVNIATGVKTGAGGATEELAPIFDEGFTPGHGFGGGTPTGGGTGAAGGSSIAPGQSPGDPPVSGSGSAMAGGGVAFSGGKMDNDAGNVGTDFPAAGTVIKLDIWNNEKIAGVDCTLDTAGNRIIVNKTGKWRVHARWFAVGNGADTDWSWAAYIYVNGVETTRHFDFSSGASAHSVGQQMEVDDVLALTSGDIIDVRGSVFNEASPVSPGQGRKDDIFEVIYLGS